MSTIEDAGRRNAEACPLGTSSIPTTEDEERDHLDRLQQKRVLRCALVLASLRELDEDLLD
jgi:hypothetical protein